MSRVISFAAELWLYDGDSGWHFVSVPPELSQQVREETDHVRRGFGSLKVRATIGGSTWETSIFPSSTGSYLLPVKKPVRRAEGLSEGDPVDVRLELLDL